jgi:hypothetical protein
LGSDPVEEAFKLELQSKKLMGSSFQSSDMQSPQSERVWIFEGTKKIPDLCRAVLPKV